MLTDLRAPLTSRRFALLLTLTLLAAALLRFLFPAADPPWNPGVGIVWHDEGAWVHNARNKALVGSWTLDAWNPMYIAPVFTWLEYVSFSTFGVGVRQARLVPELTGLASVLLLALGVRRLAGREAGLIAGALLATNYVYVMWNRAALMEAPMTALIVAAWYCYVRAQERPWWGLLAGVCALLAYFTKASAVFFVAALGLEALVASVAGQRWNIPASRAAGRMTLAGLTAAAAVALLAFVVPNWTEYRFYNWQMSVTRKPSYDARALLDRLTWLPILHDVFTRMWAVLLIATLSLVSAASRWRQVAAGERLLFFWVGLGALELLLHDVGNERRFVFFIPALIALAAIVLGRYGTLVPSELARVPRTRALLALPFVAYGAYVVAGALVRIGYLYDVRPNVRLAAAVAGVLTIALYATWPRVPRLLSRGGWSPAAGLLIAAVLCAGDVVQYGQWAAGRSYKNVEASRALATRLPPDTLVHGKLANGLALENRIRPIFVGRNFGNYRDRRDRDDVRYILTYVAPRLGYEGSVIEDVLEAYPNRTIIMTFDVAETSTGHDRAALIDKFGTPPPPSAIESGPGRAQD
jgi:4-amino-4-deoxy-L-arabinose transferase-like glycosyltransferase